MGASPNDKPEWHNSLFSTLADCEQKFVYRYVEGLEDESDAMLLGSWVHALLQVQGLRQGFAKDTLIDPPSFLDLGRWDELQGLDISRVSDPGFDGMRWAHERIAGVVLPGIDPWEHEDAMAAWNLVQRYLFHRRDALFSEDVLAVEYEWTRERGGVMYGGSIDRVVRNSDGLITVRDHKTTGRKPSGNLRLSNTQLHLYAWGIAPVIHEALGVTADAVEYDYLITTKVPDVKLTQAGNLYKYAKGADQWSLINGLKALGEDPADWEDAILAAEDNAERWFQHATMPVNVTAIRNMFAEHDQLIARAHTLERVPARALRNRGTSCDWCQFADVCTAEFYGADATLLKEEFKRANH